MYLIDFLSLLDARSFSSPWFWLVLVGLWTLAGRGVLGVPNDVLARVSAGLRGKGEGAEAELLLDWLSLQLPRWQIGPRMGAVLTAAVCFALSTLGLLGFLYQFEMAQALTLLAAPFALLLALRLRLAAQLLRVLDAAHRGQPPQTAARDAMRRINRYRAHHMAVSLLAVTAAAFWASRWIVLHPNGL